MVTNISTKYFQTFSRDLQWINFIILQEFRSQGTSTNTQDIRKEISTVKRKTFRNHCRHTDKTKSLKISLLFEKVVLGSISNGLPEFIPFHYQIKIAKLASTIRFQFKT